MRYDFLEIGTCDFDTIMSHVPDSATGIVMEAIGEYLYNLPNKPNIIKIPAAIVPEHHKEKEIDVYYVKWDIITANNLGRWLRGCNSVGKPHDLHLRYCHDINLWHWHNVASKTHQIADIPTINLLEAGLVTVEKIKCLTYKDIVEQYNVDAFTKVKLDIEGMDCAIVLDILEYHKDKKDKLPYLIEFEANGHTHDLDRMLTLETLKSFDYDIGFICNKDSGILEGICATKQINDQDHNKDK